MSYIHGQDRHQQVLFPESLDDYIDAANSVRFLDVFVNRLDLKALGFTHATLNQTGRPSYHPRDMLKLYLSGYLNKIRSSRKLEHESQRLDQERHEQVTAWRLCPVVDALQALRGVQLTVAVTTGAALGDLPRFENPRQRMHYLGLTPSESSSGERRRQGGITQTGNTHARRALVEGAWASRYPAKVSRHLQRRLAKLPKPIQDVSWKAQVRLCKRYRQLCARGKNPNQVVVAIARELRAFMWAIAQQVPVTA